MARMKEKYIFLDVDGVLNSQDTFISSQINNLDPDDPYYELDKGNLSYISQLFSHHPDAHVVLSSSWRGNPILEDRLMHAFDDFSIPFPIGRTPRLRSSRGSEIEEWMNRNNVDKSQILIIDDESDMGNLKDRLIQTSFYKGGFGQRELEKAIRMLDEI